MTLTLDERIWAVKTYWYEDNTSEEQHSWRANFTNTPLTRLTISVYTGCIHLSETPYWSCVIISIYNTQCFPQNLIIFIHNKELRLT